MQVRKRNGSLEPVNLDKIVGSIRRVCEDLGSDVDVFKVATKTVGGLVDGVSTREIDLLSIRNAVGLIAEDPNYSKVAGRILANVIQKEVANQDIFSFSLSIETGYREGLISEATHDLVMANKRKLNDRIRQDRDWNFEFHGIQTLYDRYLLKHPTLPVIEGSKQRAVIETPQFFLMRVACGLANDASEAIELYDLLSSLEYMASTPTLFNSGTKHSQMSSCFVAGTEVMTLDGPKPIETVVVGDQVITHAGTVRTVRQLHANPLNGRTLFDVKCLGTPSFTVTGNHRLWSISEEQLGWGATIPTWNRVDYLRTGDWVAIPNWRGEVSEESIDIASLLSLFPGDGRNVRYEYSVNADTIGCTSHWTRADHLNGDPEGIAMSKAHVTIKRTLKIDKDFACFLGIWYGDGHLIQRRNGAKDRIPSGIGVTLHRDNAEAIAFCKRISTDYLGVEPKEHDVEDQNVIQLLMHSTLLGNMFKHFFGHGFGGKKLYAGCGRWDRDLFRAFLTGLITSDGCVGSNGTISVAMANPPLVKSIFLTARNLGFPVTFRMDNKQSRYARQAAINLPPESFYPERVWKTYDGATDRIGALEERKLSTSIRRIGETTFVRIMRKTVNNTSPEYVYTLGVEEDHSYPVEGIVAENCYLLDSPNDSLDDLYKRLQDVALLSKFAGGIGVSYSRIRGKGALIKGTNGKSNGIVPWLHSLSASVASVNQGGRRKGAAAVYLEPHHPDIMDFLELRDNTGEKERRAYNLNLANWIPDLFMKRVREDGVWSLFDPTVAPELTDLYGNEYEARYLELEEQKRFTEQLPARKIYARMMRTLAETGNGWMCFKDTSNIRGNQVSYAKVVVHGDGGSREYLESDFVNTTRGIVRAGDLRPGDEVIE